MDSERGRGMSEALSSAGGRIWPLQQGSRPGAEWEHGEEALLESMGTEGSNAHSLAPALTCLYYPVCFKY